MVESLSERLKFLSSWLDDYQECGVEVAPLAVKGMRDYVNQCELDAFDLELKALERRAISRLVKTTNSSNVIPFPGVKIERVI